MKLAKTIGTWLLQGLLAVLFVAIGVGKFQDPSWARNFARWGYPAGFHRVTGVLELAGGLALLAPPLATYGAATLGTVMVAAAITRAVHGEDARRLTVPLTYLLLLALAGWIRRRSAWRPMARNAAPRALVSG